MALHGSESFFGITGMLSGVEGRRGRTKSLSARSRNTDEGENQARAASEAFIKLERKETSTTDQTALSALLRETGSNLDRGLPQRVADRRLIEDGKNSLEETPPPTVLELVLLQASNLLLWLLMAASIASFSLEEEVEGTAVLVIVFLNLLITVVTEKQASDALAALTALAQPTATVIRDGEAVSIPTAEIVRGDIVVLRGGDVVPADAIVIESTGLSCDESLLTGESRPARKVAEVPTKADAESSLTPQNEVFSSTAVVSGEAKVIVFRVGMQTRVGEIAKMIEHQNQGKEFTEESTEGSEDEGGDEDEGEESGGCLSRIPFCVRLAALVRAQQASRTPLQIALHHLGLHISIAALLCCCLVFVIGVVREYTDPEHPANSPAASMLLVSVSLAVSAIPEGLPLCVTICLALGTHAMAKHKALVRALPAVEALGSAQVVATDKTGTLTTGRMTAVRVGIAGTPVVIKTPNPSKPHIGKFEPILPATPLLLRAAVLNSTATLCFEDDKDGEEKVTVQGNATEAPLLLAAAMCGQAAPAPTSIGVVVPFNSAWKMMASAYLPDSDSGSDQEEAGSEGGRILDEEVEAAGAGGEGEGGGGDGGAGGGGGFATSSCPRLPIGEEGAGEEVAARLLLKGAPDVLLGRCRLQLNEDGSVGELEGEKAIEMIDSFASNALRAIAVTWGGLDEEGVRVARDGDLDDEERLEKLLEATRRTGGLVFGGLVGSADPERAEVPPAVAKAQGANVRVVMITGDHRATATAIGRNVGILRATDDPEVATIDCRELDGLNRGEIDAIVQRACVFARARPQDKLVLVEAFRRIGLVTAMTGDGANDAPALAASDIGVAMGTGTAVAKGAAGLVLLDDNFATIAKAIEDGRVIYARIQKFITYLLGTNATQVASILIAVATGLPIPLKPLSILLLNLAIDGAPAMALSVEPGAADTMQHPPRPRNEPILTPKILSRVFLHAATTTIAMLTSFVLGLYFYTGGTFLVNDLAHLTSADTCQHLVSTGEYNVAWQDRDGEECRVVGLAQARSMAFATIAFCEILRAFSVRTDASAFQPSLLFANRPLLTGVLVATFLTLLTLLTPGVQQVWDFASLDWFAWLIILLLTAFVFLADEALKSRQRNIDQLLMRLDRIEAALQRLAP